MPTPHKIEGFKLRVTAEMKNKVMALAFERGESEGVIIREAINWYIEHLEKGASGTASDRGRLAGIELNEKLQSYKVRQSKGR